MKKYEEIVKRSNLIREYCEKYRTELTIAGGIIAEANYLTKYKDYVKFVKDLSDDAFYANYLVCLFNDIAIIRIKDVLNEKSTINDYVKDLFDDVIIFDSEKSYRKYRRELKKEKAQ